MDNIVASTPQTHTTTPGDAPTPELINDMPSDNASIQLYTETNEMPMDNYYATTAPMDGASIALIVGMMGVWLVIAFGIIIITIVAFWKIFTKAGVEGWKSLIPIYNTWVLLEISGKPGWWLFLLFIPFVNIVIMVMVYNSLSKAFGKGIGYTLGLIFLSPIFFLMLAFGNAKYTKPVEEGDGENVTPPQQPQNQTM